MWLMIVAGSILALVALLGLWYLIQELDAWLWHWWHYTLPNWRMRYSWKKSYREFERRNRW